MEILEFYTEKVFAIKGGGRSKVFTDHNTMATNLLKAYFNELGVKISLDVLRY